MFFAGAILFANMDVLSGEAFFESNFVFKETDPLNEKFDSMGMSSLNFVMNTGSYFILLILIYLSFYIRRCINYVCTKFARYKLVRKLALKVHEHKEEPIKMQLASIKLFLESYFDITMANMLGITGLYLGY